MQKKSNNPLLLFYLLVAYVLIQLIWWGYLMCKLNFELYELKTQNIQAVVLSAAEAQAKYQKKFMMILGEGSVFLVLLIAGVWKTRKSFKKETELNNQQKNFLMSISHELKSPLASAKLQLQTLLKHDLEKNKQKEIIQNALSDTERLENTVDNVLLAASIENSDVPAHKEVLNLSDIISELVKTNEHFRNNNIEIDSVDNLQINVDKFALQSIITNLLENAIKYSQQSPQIKIAIKKQQQIILSIADNGIGISDDERQNIFKKFYRIGNESTRKTKGTGLGLYIVKQLCDANQISIEVKNNKPDGTIFELKFSAA